MGPQPVMVRRLSISSATTQESFIRPELSVVAHRYRHGLVAAPAAARSSPIAKAGHV